MSVDIPNARTADAIRHDVQANLMYRRRNRFQLRANVWYAIAQAADRRAKARKMEVRGSDSRGRGRLWASLVQRDEQKRHRPW